VKGVAAGDRRLREERHRGLDQHQSGDQKVRAPKRMISRSE
jgi:hypothetical protein